MPRFNESVIDNLKKEGYLKTKEEDDLLNILTNDRWPIYQTMAKNSAIDGCISSRPLDLFLTIAKRITSIHNGSPYFESCVASGLLAIFDFSNKLIEST
jgi:hypothetical protein